MHDSLVIDPGPHLKAAMSQSIKECSLSREQIAEDMNRLAGMCGITCNGNSQKVTEAILDKWVAPGASAHNIPIRLLPIFCRVVGSNAPLQVYAATFLDARVISKEDHKVFEWAKAEIDCRQARKRSRRIAQEVGIE